MKTFLKDMWNKMPKKKTVKKTNKKELLDNLAKVYSNLSLSHTSFKKIQGGNPVGNHSLYINAMTNLGEAMEIIETLINKEKL